MKKILNIQEQQEIVDNSIMNNNSCSEMLVSDKRFKSVKFTMCIDTSMRIDRSMSKDQCVLINVYRSICLPNA